MTHCSLRTGQSGSNARGRFWALRSFINRSKMLNEKLQLTLLVTHDVRNRLCF